MGRRIIAIDETNNDLRIVVLETRLRRFEIRGVFHVQKELISESWGKDEVGDGKEGSSNRRTIRQVLNSILDTPLSQSDSIVVSFPGEYTSVQHLEYPFKDVEKIAQVVPSDMVGRIPIKLEELHYAFERVSISPEKTEVLCVGVPASRFREFLEKVLAEDIDPDYVTPDGVCLTTLLPFISNNTTSMIIHVEGTHMEVVVADKLRPVLVRTVELFENVIEHGEVSPGFLREVLLTASSASELNTPVKNIFVAGSQADMICEEVRNAVGIDCSCIDPSRFNIVGASKIVSSQYTKGLAMALSAAVSQGPGVINLRCGQFSMEGRYSLIGEHLKFFGIMGILALCLSICWGVTKYISLTSERDALVEEMKKFSSEVLGKERTDFDGILGTLKSLSEDDVQIFPRWTSVDIFYSILSVLMEVGKGTSVSGGGEQAFRLEIENIRIENKFGSMRGEADTIETLDSMVAKLNADPCIHDVSTESTERIQFQRHQGWQRFSLKFQIDCGGGGDSKKGKQKEGK